MKLLFHKYALRYVVLGILGVLIFGVGVRAILTNNQAGREQAQITRGTVTALVSVSGVVRTKNTATLGFSNTGIVEEILVEEGDKVDEGQVLASLVRSLKIADYNDALAALQSAEAALQELIAGPRAEARDVTQTQVALAREELARTIKEEDQQVENARRLLYSQSLAAVPADPSEDAAAPLITGNYTCANPQTYFFETYASGADSGYSFRITGSSGTQTLSVTTETAVSFGSCGLYIQFIDGERYNNSKWSIEVPNSRSAVYTTNKNAYELAQQERSNAIDAARQALEKAEKEAGLANASPRSEELIQAEANVAQARSRVAAAEAQIENDTIRAPFAGIITSVDIAQGETARTDTGITMTADDAYELKIRVPEIDITKIAEGDRAIASFDAKMDESVALTITFISPLPTEIDGVSYYEALLSFEEVPPWMRTGLNADVDIIIEEAKDVLMVPKRFISETAAGPLLYVLEGRNEIETPIRRGLTGNDGFTEVLDIPEGTTVIAP